MISVCISKMPNQAWRWGPVGASREGLYYVKKEHYSTCFGVTLLSQSTLLLAHVMSPNKIIPSLGVNKIMSVYLH